MKILLILLLMASVTQGANNDFIFGTILNATDSNSFYINVTSSNITGVTGVMQVLSARPQKGLADFVGKDLFFDVVGHDTLGRLVVDRYYYNEQNQNLTAEQLVPGTYINLLGDYFTSQGGSKSTIIQSNIQANGESNPPKDKSNLPEDLIPGKGNAYGLIKHMK